MAKVVNLFAGPGAGKSTLAYLITGKLKLMGIEAELASEYAKDIVWREAHKVLRNQVYVFAKQYERIWRCHEKVDYIVTDSPLLLSIIYKQPSIPESFDKLVVDLHNQFNNINIFIKRPECIFSNIGRIHDEETSKQIDNKIIELLETHNIPYYVIENRPNDEKVIDEIIMLVLKT